MSEVLGHISSFAIWGSLTASVVLGCSLIAQAILFTNNRSRLLLFAVLILVSAAVDSLHAYLTPLQYEMLRLFIWSLYGPMVYFVFGGVVSRVAGGFFALLVCGGAVWQLYDPALATTAVLPVTFGIAAYTHWQRFRSHHAFGSCVLFAASTCQALACATYFWIMALENPSVILLGYAHYAFVSLIAVFFGWIHIPREMALGVPVRVNPRRARLFFLLFIGAECIAMPPFLISVPAGYYSYALATGIQALSLLFMYLLHKHELVIYTDNVARLLEERTESLRDAQGELSRQNELQKARLEKQEQELQLKAQVIERQSRLELAAQTAGQAAHDIQNLLSPLIIHLDRLSRSRLTLQQVHQVVDTLKANARDLLDLNGQLLALARRGRVEHDPVHVPLLIEEVLRQIPAFAPVVEVNVAADLWIAGGRSQLRRALVNTLTNAYEACAEKVSVQVHCRLVTVDRGRACHLGFLEPGEYATIEVRDSGGGIPPAVFERIFEPFFSTKGAHGSSGSGLGLSIVAGVIEDHSGVIDVQTGTDGTTFTFYFKPLAVDAASAGDARDLSELPAVVICGHSYHSQLLHDFLLEKQYRVFLVKTERSLLSLLTRESVPVLLLYGEDFSDCGSNLLYSAIQLQPFIKAVVIAATVQPDQREKLRQLGVEEILEEDVEPSIIEKCLLKIHHQPNGVREIQSQH